jgi:hypothetical protein
VGGCSEDRETEAPVIDLPVRFTAIPPLGGPPPNRVTIHQLLEQLRATFEKKGKSVTSTLLPPISEIHLAAQCGWFPAALPEEILALYTWRGGQQLEDDGAEPFWFRDVIFIPPDAAEREYRSMMETYGKLMPASFLGVDLSRCFPFAAFNGGWYVFPCGGQALSPEFPRPIVSVFQGFDIYYHSLALMLKTCVAWVEDPAYGSDSWEDAEMKIWTQFNPGVFEDRG